MNRRISRKMEQSSVELPMSNGIMNSQSNWSRCNSFSSSSSDSTVYCSNSRQHCTFSGRKRLKNDESIGKIIKRSRNSSGSSASSNMSCMSDKVINHMPTLMSTEQVSHEINNVANLEDISPSTFQRETLLNSRLSHPLDMNAVLPFRHNLRQNIRRKTCSCDCTATCTTVVVSRQYKEIGEKTVEEKTVISRTKVKTFVDSNSTQTPIRQVQMSSKVSFQENMACEDKKESSLKQNVTNKSECNRKRRSEIERLYESLHEIKWAKNFSPDNILRQFDVRQAASCSAFGKTSEEKLTKSDNKANKCFKVSHQINKKNPIESLGSIKINKSEFTRNNKFYSTRSKFCSSLKNFGNKLEEEDSNPPILEKSIIITTDESLDIDFPTYNSYPILSKEVSTPKKAITIISKNNAADLSPATYDAIDTNCPTLRTFPEKMFSFDVNLHHNIDKQIINIVDCYDPEDDNIHTIDACFKEVGAEVVVSTSCDNDFNSLPLLTAVREINTSFSQDYPPKLEQCESSFSLSHENSVINCNNNNILGVKSSHLEYFFPPVNPSFIFDEDYSLTLSFLEDCKRNYSVDEKNCASTKKYPKIYECEKILPVDIKCDKMNTIKASIEKKDVKSFCDINEDNDLKTEPHLPSLSPVEKIENIITEPSILEPCISDKICVLNIKSQISISENITNNDIHVNKSSSDSLSDVCDETNCIINGTNNFSMKSKNLNQICQLVNHLKTKSFIITLGRRVLKKYRRFTNLKSKRQCKLFKLCHKSIRSSVSCQKSSQISNNFRNMENFSTNDKSSAIPLSVINCAKISPSVEIIKSAMFSHPSSQITEAFVNKKCMSSGDSCLPSSEAVLNAKSATVIHNFNQRFSFLTSQENITLKQLKNGSILHQVEEKPGLNNNKKAKKPSLNNIFNNHCSENFADIPGYSKILLAAKRKDGHAEEKIKVPLRVFTCHFQTINVTRDNDYIQIVLKVTRGKSIFLTHETLVELKEAISKAGNDKDCRLLILNGFGQTFCLGLDVRPLVGDHKNEIVGDIAKAIKDLIGTLADFQKPLVAIVNGAAYGLGLTILNHADVTLATSNASFCMPYSRLGYMPEGGATLTLPQAVGTTIAMDLILRGQVITAEQARDIGLINEVVEVRYLPQDLVSRVQAIAQNSLPGMQATKAMIKMRLHIQLPLVLETEAKLLPQMWLSSSCQEAIQNVLDSGFFEDC